MDKNAFLKTIFLYLCILFLIIGCNSANMDTLTVVPRETSVSILETPTSTFNASASTPTPPAISTATVLPTHTLTTAPTPSPTLTKTPVLTPLPTLSPDEAQTLVVDLLQNNRGCQLPCWWGVIPGETPWQPTRRFLATFALEFEGSVSPSETIVMAYFPVPEEIYTLPLRHTYTIRDDVIQTIDAYIASTPAYNLSAILDTYGQPAEVWIKTFRESRDNSLPFAIALFYPEHDFVIDYSVQNAQISGDQVQGCPQEKTSTFLSVWSPEEELTFAEAVGRRLEFGTRPYFPLAEVSNMDVTTFYETFKDPKNTTCLETPADLWPWPG